MAKWIPTKRGRISFVVLLALLFLFLMGCLNPRYMFYIGACLVAIGIGFLFVGMFYKHIVQSEYGRRLVSFAKTLERIIQGNDNNSGKDNGKPKPDKPPTHFNGNKHNNKSSNDKADTNFDRFSIHTTPPEEKP
jgi:hypothetical protein